MLFRGQQQGKIICKILNLEFYKDLQRIIEIYRFVKIYSGLLIFKTGP